MTTKRACFTINNPTFKDSETLYALGHSDQVKYLIYGAEHDEHGTPHFQGFVVFNDSKKRDSICARLGGRAWVGFPKREDPSARCANYCKKEGFYFEFGSLPGNQGASNVQIDAGLDPETAKELRRKAVEWLDDPANTYTRLKDINASLLMTPGFLNAWYAKRKVLLGPDRDLTYITIVGPTACGKSYAAHNIFPDHAKVFYGNSGAWFANGDAPVLLLEEYNGQIPLQKLLSLLDHYPTQLEEKGSFSPAMYTTVVITSNITPDHWYTNFIRDARNREEAARLGISLEEAEKRWNEAKKALFDRIGFGTNFRGSGFYRAWQVDDEWGDPLEQRLRIRQEIWDWVQSIIHPVDPPTPLLPIEDDEDTGEPPHQLRRYDATSDLEQEIDTWADHVISPFHF